MSVSCSPPRTNQEEREPLLEDEQEEREPLDDEQEEREPLDNEQEKREPLDLLGFCRSTDEPTREIRVRVRPGFEILGRSVGFGRNPPC